MDTFSVGEVAEFCNSEYFLHLEGTECVIVGGLGIRERDSGGKREYAMCYLVRAAYDGKIYAPSQHNIRKKRPPSEYDGNQVTKWDDCPFKPREVVRV